MSYVFIYFVSCALIFLFMKYFIHKELSFLTKTIPWYCIDFVVIGNLYFIFANWLLQTLKIPLIYFKSHWVWWQVWLPLFYPLVLSLQCGTRSSHYYILEEDAPLSQLIMCRLMPQLVLWSSLLSMQRFLRGVVCKRTHFAVKWESCLKRLCGISRR